ncbi:MAG: ABC transporter substrate-binding protein [Rhizobiaceae bacterium]
MKKRMAMIAAVSAAMLTASVGASFADVTTVRLAKEFGVGYLPLSVMQKQKLLVKNAKKEGLDIETKWLRFTGGAAMNDALLSGSLDIAAGGVGPMLTLWSRTQSNYGFKSLGTLDCMPLELVSVNPKVKKLADFTSSDRIALPAVKTSIQAVTLQMAAKKAFGAANAQKLDKLTVSMGHPDALLAMLGGKSGITAHFGSPPFQNIELRDKRAHVVVNSYDVLGGPHTFNLTWASKKFVEGNPKIAKAFVEALNESLAFIKANPEKAADIWMSEEKTPLTKEEIVAIIKGKDVIWTAKPKNMLPYLHFMHQIGLVKNTTDNASDLFFPVTKEANEG